MSLHLVEPNQLPIPEGGDIRSLIPDFAKDIRLNWGAVLTTEGSPDLTSEQVFGVALAAAYATKNHLVVQELRAQVSDEVAHAAKAAASIMVMNNIYYRSTHLIADNELKQLPAKLRMNVIANPGIPKVDFELMSLAVSAINGCGMCLESHAHEVKKAGISTLGVQSVLRIASVVNAAAFSIAVS